MLASVSTATCNWLCSGLEIFPAMREAIVHELKRLGFTYVALDLQGFRSGSLNEPLRS